MRKAENPAEQARRDERECPWKYTWEKENPIVVQGRRLHATRIVTSTRVARSRLEAFRPEFKNHEILLRFIVIYKEMKSWIKILFKQFFIIFFFYYSTWIVHFGCSTAKYILL